MAYMVNAVGPTVVYVSGVSANGLPVGNDSTGLGTAAAPMLTIDRAIAVAALPCRVKVNGVTASPTLYTLANSTITAALTIEGITSRGVVLAAATGTNYALQFAQTGGQVATLQGVIVDPSQNTAGPATSAIGLTPQSTKYGVRLIDTEIKGWSSSGYSIVNTASGIKVDLTLTDWDQNGGDVRGGANILTWAAGSLTITRGHTTLTAQNLSGPGAFIATASVAGVVATVTDHVLSSTYSGSFSGSSGYGMILTNIVSTITGGSYAINSPFVGTLPNGYPLAVSQGRLTDLYQLPIDNSVIDNVTVTSNAYGGAGVRMGDDDADKTLANNCQVTRITFTGDANFVAHGGHSIFAVNLTSPVVSNNFVTTGGIGYVDKGNSGFYGADNYCKNHASSSFLMKGSVNSQHVRPITLNELGYSGPHVSLGVGDDNNAGVYSVGSVSGGLFQISGAADSILVSCETGNTLTPTTNSYQLLSGSANALPWRRNGTNYATFGGPSGWKTLVEPTATSNIP